MNMWNKSLLLVAALMMSSAAMAQTMVGYTNGTLSRNEISRFGNTEKQGMAVYIDAEKSCIVERSYCKEFLDLCIYDKSDKWNPFHSERIGRIVFV